MYPAMLCFAATVATTRILIVVTHRQVLGLFSTLGRQDQGLQGWVVEVRQAVGEAPRYRCQEQSGWLLLTLPSMDKHILDKQ